MTTPTDTDVEYMLTWLRRAGDARFGDANDVELEALWVLVEAMIPMLPGPLADRCTQVIADSDDWGFNHSGCW